MLRSIVGWVRISDELWSDMIHRLKWIAIQQRILSNFGPQYFFAINGHLLIIFLPSTSRLGLLLISIGFRISLITFRYYIFIFYPQEHRTRVGTITLRLSPLS